MSCVENFLKINKREGEGGNVYQRPESNNEGDCVSKRADSDCKNEDSIAQYSSKDLGKQSDNEPDSVTGRYHDLLSLVDDHFGDPIESELANVCRIVWRNIR